MNTTYYRYLLMLAAVIPIASCQDHEIDNPFDSECPREIWTPSDFKAVQQQKSVLLTWSRASVTHISGYRLERRINNGEWKVFSTPDKSSTSWADNDLKPGQVHEYLLYAYALGNTSNQLKASLTPVFPATVTTMLPPAIVCPTTTVGGDVTDDGGSAVTEKGVVYGLTPDVLSGTRLTIGSGKGSFSQSVSGLVPGTRYYVWAYAVNNTGTIFGDSVVYSTASVPVLTTGSPAQVTDSRATLGGTLTHDGGGGITEMGVVYATIPGLVVSGPKIPVAALSGSFTAPVINLVSSTQYYFRAYAVNCAGPGYGPEVSFSTLPSVLLSSAAESTVSNATATGIAEPGGGIPITGRGFCWSTHSNPTLADFSVSAGQGPGTFTANLTGLACNTYYVRSYASNSSGTAYSTKVIPVTITNCTVLNLFLRDLKLSSPSVRRGQSVTISCTVHIYPSLLYLASGVKVGFYLSSNPDWDSRDVLFGQTNVLVGGKYGSQAVTSLTATVPLTTPAGSVYIICVADYDNAFTESNETDNHAATTLMIL